MFAARLAATQARLEAGFAGRLAEVTRLPLGEAMRYALRGGKRLRGFLALESAALFDIPEPQAIDAALAVEALHAYSLVHDDLPAMDDDDLRRGQPTLHVKWDEATAILAGDALQTLAFELLAGPGLGAAERRIALVAGLARASGARGMVYGQALDIAAETAAASLSLPEIIELQVNKTGALIEWAATAGAVLAGEEPAPLQRYARAIGLAFQIQDDILDVEGDVEAAGKRLRKDAAANKATFVSLLGLEGARSEAARLVAEAEAALAPYGAKAETLKQIARYIIARDR